MSFMLYELSSWSKDTNFQHRLQRQTQQARLKKSQAFQKFDTCITKHLSRHKQFTDTLISEDAQSKTYGVLLQNISSLFRGLLSFKYNKRKQEVLVFFHFLGKGEEFLKFQSSQILSQFYRTLLLITDSCYRLVKVLLNPFNRNVCLELCYYSFKGSNIIEDMDRSVFFHSKNLILDIYRNYIAQFIPLFQKAFRVNIPIEQRLDGQQKVKLLENINRYTKMMTLKSHLRGVVLTSQEARAQQLNQRQHYGKRLLNRTVPIDENMVKPCELFFMVKKTTQKKYPIGSHEFSISSAQQRSLISAIALDNGQLLKSEDQGHQNTLNYIKVHQPQNLKIQPLHVGGFSFLDSSEVYFWYVDSFGKENMDVSTRNIQKRHMAIKRENRPHGKNLHEYRILKEIRNGMNPIIPKYFIPINFPNYELQKNPLLMMQFLPDGNLGQFLRNQKICLSLTSKLYLMFSITMGLRYLQLYKIVHLDLKPNNIMLSHSLLTKIIDFGQSYHPQVYKCEKQHYKPGITLPYTPPEYLIGLKNGFTTKADVYSLGIIMFQILYGRLPIFTRQKLFLAPQVSDLYGQSVVIRLLNLVISRSLSINPQLRPSLEWVAILIRLSMELIV